MPREPPGRPRIYKNAKEADHAFYMRHRDRLRRKRVISPNKAESEEARERRIAQLVEAALPPRAVVPNGEDTHGLTLEASGGLFIPTLNPSQRYLKFSASSHLN